MKYKFSCPHCGQRIATTPEYIGVQAACPTCSLPFEVPAPDAFQDAPDATPSRGIEFAKAKAVSSKEFADAVWELMQKSARECHARLETALGNTNMKLNIDDQTVLSREIIIAHLWAIAKAISPDTRALDALDDRYFIGHYNLGATKEEKVSLAKAAESELQDRYAAYYKASEADDKHARDRGERGTLTSLVMLQRFFPTHKPVRNVVLTTLLQTHIDAFIGSLLEFRSQFTINDT
jgi:hypothetical protein